MAPSLPPTLHELNLFTASLSCKGVRKCNAAVSPGNKRKQIGGTVSQSLPQALSRKARMTPPPGHPYAWCTAKGPEGLTGACLCAELTFSWDSQ